VKRLTASDENLVGPVFVPQLGCIALPRLELDGDLGVVEQVCPLEDNAEAALADLLADAVVYADDIAATRGHC
jgi:ubiquinone biosynthesis protein UbiJ